MLRSKFIAINAYIRNEKKSEFDNLPPEDTRKRKAK